ncbi:MAG: MFS transporter, partial [Promethearchaeota archaeon]
MNSSQQLRELKGKRLFGYTFGNFGMSLVNVFTGTYLFQFYVYTINLDSVLASVGISVNVFISAFFSIIFGVIMDNKKPGKLGKRRVFLLYALPFWIITNIIVWLPPWYCPVDNRFYLPTAIYFWVVTIIGALSRTVIFNAYLAMLPEQSQTLENRHSVASLRAFFMIVASFVSVLMALLVQSFLPAPQDAKWYDESGKIVLFFIPIVGIIFSILGLVIVLILFFSVDESFYSSNSKLIKEKTTLKDTVIQMAQPAKDYNYRNLALVSFFVGISGSTLGLLVFPVQIILLEFDKSKFFIYAAISIFGKLSWYLIWKMTIKKKSLTSSYSLSLIFAAVVS